MVFVLFMLLVWQRSGGKSSGGVQLVDWLVVRVFYAVTDFMMLNAIDFGRFVTLTFWHCVTPQQRTHRFTTKDKCCVF